MSWKEEYKRRRDVKLYFKDKLKDVLPVSEINEEVKNRLKSYSVERRPRSLNLVANLEYFIRDPITKQILLKEGSGHAKNYVNTVNETASIKGLNLKAYFLPSSPYHKKVEAVGRIELDGKTEDLLSLASMFNRFLLDQQSVNFCHSLTYQLFLDDKEFFNLCYVSKDLPENLKRMRKGCRVKQPYKEAYSLKDIPKIVEHYEIVGDVTADYCKNYGISLKCLRTNNWFSLLKELYNRLPNEGGWLELDKKSKLEESVSLRNWPKFYKRGPIRIEEKEDIKEINQRLLAFEIIRNCHPTGFEILSEEAVHNMPIDAIRDVDPLSLEYQDVLKTIRTILNFDKEVGIKDVIIRASGSSVGGYHLFIPLIYSEKVIAPSSQLKLETYERRKSPGEILLDSLRETILTYSLILALKTKINVGFDPRSFSDRIESDAIIDTSSMSFNKGWKAPGSLNSKTRYGVCRYTEEPFEGYWDYMYFTSMHYVHENVEKIIEPKISDKTRRENFKVLRDFIEENKGKEIILEYDKRKKYESHSELLAHLRKII